MIWRFFKRRGATTSVVEDQHEVTDRSVEPSSRPRLSAFNYDSIRKDRQAEEPAADSEISDTEVESPAIEPPKQGLAEIVRERTNHRRFLASDRGIRPVFVPSLRENATRLRLRADALQEQSPEHALQLWREYITLCPRDSDAWYAFGQSALMSGLDRQAHRAFSTTVELDPHMAWPRLRWVLGRKPGTMLQLRCTIPGLSSYGPIALICSVNWFGYVRHGSGRGG